MNKMIICCIAFLALISSAQSQQCWRNVLTFAGYEIREVFIGYTNGPPDTVLEEYDSGQRLNKTVCYHYGDIWCDGEAFGVTLGFCYTNCCNVTVIADADKVKCASYCHCGFEERCINVSYPVMAYRDVIKPRLIPVFQNQSFPKYNETRLEVACQGVTQICTDQNETYECGTHTYEGKCGETNETYECGNETVIKFDCYDYRTEICGTIEREVFIGYELTNPHDCVKSVQYPTGQNVIREVCTYSQRKICNSTLDADLAWCQANCQSILELTNLTLKQECTNRCVCKYEDVANCTNQTFPEWAYQDVTQTCYDQTPQYANRSFNKECQVQFPRYKNVTQPLYCNRTVDVICNITEPVYCNRTVQVCVPSTQTTPQPPLGGYKYKPNANYINFPGMQDWCNANCIDDQVTKGPSDACLAMCVRA